MSRAQPPAVTKTSKVSASSTAGMDSDHGLPGTLYLDVAGYWSSSSATIQGQSQSLALNQQGISLTLAPMWSGFFLGAGTDYRMVNNSKTPDSQVGSLKGTRWAPIVVATGYCAESFVLKLEYEPSGDFHLAQPTYQGATITYSGGSGFRASFLYSVYSGLMFGPSYESLQFANRLDSVNGQIDNQALSMTQIGLIGAYVF